jgi:hypothetical protein
MEANGQARPADATFAQVAGLNGWHATEDKRVIIHNGLTYMQADGSTERTQFTDFFIQPHTFDDVRKFIAVNTGHVGEQEILAENIWWVHAVRFWSVVTGLVTGSKQSEWVEVPNPTDDLEQYTDDANRIIEFQDNALTASAARVASWRKTNHATGGPRATGFPRRWLGKNGFWINLPDKSQTATGQLKATTAFYIATHATCVHNALSLMAGSDHNHWASIDPKYGFLMRWDVRESTSIRMLPAEQVSGVAMVTDSMVVLKMLTQEGIYPMLENRSQARALVNAFNTVIANGIRVASYASWFLDGHPGQVTKVPFNQKDPQYASLIGELGAVATTYYGKSTIGQSPALDNAKQQLASETSKGRWSALSRAKASATNEMVIRAYANVTGSAVGDMFRGLASSELDIVTPAVASYNEMLTDASTMLNIAEPVQLVAEDIIKNAKRIAVADIEGE